MKNLQFIDGKAYEECQVVMLPTEKASNLYKRVTGELIYENISSSNRLTTNQHLYVLSNEEPKEGDWCLITINGGKNYHIWKYVSHNGKSDYSYVDISGTVYKWGFAERTQIIATTDETLGLSRPSNEFIKKYCGLGGIDYILVEQEIDFYNEEFENYILKIAHDNTITIKPIQQKESWSREEIEVLIYKAIQDYTGDMDCEIKDDFLDRYWLKENLK